MNEKQVNIYRNSGGKLVQSTGGRTFGIKYLEDNELVEAAKEFGMNIDREGKEVLTDINGQIIKDPDKFIVTVGEFKGMTVAKANAERAKRGQVLRPENLSDEVTL